MKSIMKQTSAILLACVAFNSVASAQSLALRDIQPSALKSVPLIKLPPVQCLSCPDLTKLPKLDSGLTEAERIEAIAELDQVIQDLRDLPDVSPEILTSVDYWERLGPAEKEQILGHKFGNNFNWAAAGVVIAAVALAYQVGKDYTNRWRPGELNFDHILDSSDLNYQKNPAFQQRALNQIRTRINALHGLNNLPGIAQGLNF